MLEHKLKISPNDFLINVRQNFSKKSNTKNVLIKIVVFNTSNDFAF
jgi:hypothetical protein